MIIPPLNFFNSTHNYTAVGKMSGWRWVFEV